MYEGRHTVRNVPNKYRVSDVHYGIASNTCKTAPVTSLPCIERNQLFIRISETVASGIPAVLFVKVQL